MKPYLAQIKSNLRLMGRDRSVLFFSYLFPLTFFFIFAQTFGAAKSPAAMAQVIAAVLIIGVLGSGFFGAGMRTVQERETNILRRFKVAPITPGPVIVASMVSGLVAFLPLVIMFLVIGNVYYHAPFPSNIGSLLLFVGVGVVAFRAMGMIVASVVNSSQEAQLLIQLLYLPMLFLSGATFPVSIMPIWLQTIAQFLPATYLFQGIQSILLAGETIFANLFAVLALTITLCVALFVGIKLFRWEKEEKIQNSAKLWILAVLAPFILMGVYQARTQQNIKKEKILTREMMRKRSFFYQNAKIIVGDGTVIPNGSVLVREGKIAQVFQASPTDTKSLQAEVINASGKTLMPGLIDMHVHIGAPGGVYDDQQKYADPNAAPRRLAAYLYSGITAVRSTGDFLHSSLDLRAEIRSGSYLGSELFACGPLFTAEGGHPTELIKRFPAAMQQTATGEFVRLPKSPDDARRQVDELKKAGVDCIKSVLDSGTAEWGLFNHLDPAIYTAIVDQAHKDNLPAATHTGNAADVLEAVNAGSNSIEHGSLTDLIPAHTFAQMKAKGLAYDPTLSIFEGIVAQGTGRTELLDRPMLQQVGPADLLASTRSMVEKSGHKATPEQMRPFMDRQNQNLLNAYKAGVVLITGSDAGNMLVIHGPTVQHELELWVKAGIPPAAALQAATFNAATVLRVGDRIGSIRPGRDATLLLLDGDPLEDITNTERISQVMFRGEIISRSQLFDQDSK